VGWGVGGAGDGREGYLTCVLEIYFFALVGWMGLRSFFCSYLFVVGLEW